MSLKNLKNLKSLKAAQSDDQPIAKSAHISPAARAAMESPKKESKVIDRAEMKKRVSAKNDTTKNDATKNDTTKNDATKNDANLTETFNGKFDSIVLMIQTVIKAVSDMSTEMQRISCIADSNVGLIADLTERVSAHDSNLEDIVGIITELASNVESENEDEEDEDVEDELDEEETDEDETDEEELDEEELDEEELDEEEEEEEEEIIIAPKSKAKSSVKSKAKSSVKSRAKIEVVEIEDEEEDGEEDDEGVVKLWSTQEVMESISELGNAGVKTFTDILKDELGITGSFSLRKILDNNENRKVAVAMLEMINEDD